MRGIVVISDDHDGLKAARQAVHTEIPGQRCRFFLMRNAMAHAPPHLLEISDEWETDRAYLTVETRCPASKLKDLRSSCCSIA